MVKVNPCVVIRLFNIRIFNADSWSTDVVASDFSEPPESSQLERLEEIAEEVLPQGLLEVGSGRLCTFPIAIVSVTDEPLHVPLHVPYIS